MSNLRYFPPPPTRGHITLCEINGLLVASSSDDSGNIRTSAEKISRYPANVDVARDMLRPSLTKQNVKSTAFLQNSRTQVSTWKRALTAWTEEGLTQVLEELCDEHTIGGVIAFAARSLLSMKRWLNCMQGSLCPHLLMQNEEIVEEFSTVTDWSNGYIRSFAWHPHVTKFAVALCDDSVRVYNADSPVCPHLKFRLQRGVADLAWRPHSVSTLAVACFSCVIIWTIDPCSVAARPSSSCAQVLFCSGHYPVTSVQWSPCGRMLLTSSPKDISMMVWDTAKETCEPLKKVEGQGVSLVRWSPDGKRIFSATPAPTFRVWETLKWTCDSWATLVGRCQAACWSPDGTVLLFAAKGESIIYSLTFSNQLGDGDDYVCGSKAALPAIDLAEVVLNDGNEIVTAGGSVQAMEWNKTGERLAVTFFCKDDSCRSQELVAVFRTCVKPMLEITPCGYIRGRPEEFPLVISFQENFDDGALLSVCWSSGVISHIPLIFTSAGDDASQFLLYEKTWVKLGSSLHSSPFRVGSPLVE